MQTGKGRTGGRAAGGLKRMDFFLIPFHLEPDRPAGRKDREFLKD